MLSWLDAPGNVASDAALPPGFGSGWLAFTLSFSGASWSDDRGHPAIELDEPGASWSPDDGKPPSDASLRVCRVRPSADMTCRVHSRVPKHPSVSRCHTADHVPSSRFPTATTVFSETGSRTCCSPLPAGVHPSVRPPTEIGVSRHRGAYPLLSVQLCLASFGLRPRSLCARSHGLPRAAPRRSQGELLRTSTTSKRRRPQVPEGSSDPCLSDDG